MATIGGAHRI